MTNNNKTCLCVINGHFLCVPHSLPWIIPTPLWVSPVVGCLFCIWNPFLSAVWWMNLFWILWCHFPRFSRCVTWWRSHPVTWTESVKHWNKQACLLDRSLYVFSVKPLVKRHVRPFNYSDMNIFLVCPIVRSDALVVSQENETSSERQTSRTTNTNTEVCGLFFLSYTHAHCKYYTESCLAFYHLMWATDWSL